MHKVQIIICKKERPKKPLGAGLKCNTNKLSKHELVSSCITIK